MFSPAALADSLMRLGQSASGHFAVAYSGGLDSTALLHALMTLREQTGLRLQALHFNHGLHPDADDWQRHCARRCADWDIPFTAGHPPAPIEPREAEARAARYRWLAAQLPKGRTLLTAHHADDQLETMLLGLFSGRVREQLAGMPTGRPLGRDFGDRLLRPLLEFRRADLQAYAESQGLDWIEDPQNLDTAHARNHLRHRVLPELLSFWPNLHSQVRAGAARLTEAEQGMQTLAHRELARIARPQSRRILCLAAPLGLPALLELPDPLCRTVLREWLHTSGRGAPADTQLTEYLRQLRENPNGRAQLALADAKLCQYRRHLYLSADPVWRAAQTLHGDPQTPQHLPGGWHLHWLTDNGPGLSRAALSRSTLKLIPRPPLGSLRLAGEAHHRSLKALCQAHGIPPWERKALPVLEVDGQVAWLPGLGWVKGFACQGGLTPSLHWSGDQSSGRTACADRST